MGQTMEDNNKLLQKKFDVNVREVENGFIVWEGGESAGRYCAKSWVAKSREDLGKLLVRLAEELHDERVKVGAAK